MVHDLRRCPGWMAEVEGSRAGEDTEDMVVEEEGIGVLEGTGVVEVDTRDLVGIEVEVDTGGWAVIEAEVDMNGVEVVMGGVVDSIEADIEDSREGFKPGRLKFVEVRRILAPCLMLRCPNNCVLKVSFVLRASTNYSSLTVIFEICAFI